MSKDICNTRILFINCSKELMEHFAPSIQHGEWLDIICMYQDASRCCLDHTSTLTCVNDIVNYITNYNCKNFIIYCTNFRNDNARNNFCKMMDEKYPRNLIEFIDNPYFMDMYEVVMSYIYTLKGEPDAYGYTDDELNHIIYEWTKFWMTYQILSTAKTIKFQF